ncbi:MAG: TIGR00300 family protein, partial [Candidatus Micrarchaeota archaeon]
MISEEVEARGHLIDSKMLSRILDAILYMGGDFSIQKLEVGKTHRDKSYARILVLADGKKLAGIVSAVRKMGATPMRSESVRLARAPRDNVLPDGFYSTTNLETWVNLGSWVKVDEQRMDAAIIVEGRRAICKKM